MNKRAISTVIVILVIGTLAVVSLAIFAIHSEKSDDKLDLEKFVSLREMYSYYDFYNSLGEYNLSIKDDELGVEVRKSVVLIDELERKGYRFRILK